MLPLFVVMLFAVAATYSRIVEKISVIATCKFLTEFSSRRNRLVRLKFVSIVV